MDHGHLNADHYPIAMVWEEAELVEDRVNRQMVSEAILTQVAVSSILSKEAGEHFKKLIGKFTE